MLHSVAISWPRGRLSFCRLAESFVVTQLSPADVELYGFAIMFGEELFFVDRFRPPQILLGGSGTAGVAVEIFRHGKVESL